jgi:4-diphosphocytidyl-2-C-methyl-D-erythritol kinase
VSRGWPAPAKLNLFLHITGRRPDGYHELQTVFQLIDHGDELDFALRADGIVRRLGSGAHARAGEDLVVRAARLLQRETGCRLGVDIHLTKRLPAGGGLGGGSSDAATTLVALNRLWACDLETEVLCRLGLELGADVPVFVAGRSAWAEGVGERLEPLELPARWYAVLCPDAHLSTARLFADPELTRDCPRMTIPDFFAGGHRNVFEPVARRYDPEVDAAFAWLARRGEPRLTGSGGCLFAAFDSRQAAEAALSGLPQRWHGFVARGVSRSPLLDRLERERRGAGAGPRDTLPNPSP